jgi:hypothetical protein
MIDKWVFQTPDGLAGFWPPCPGQVWACVWLYGMELVGIVTQRRREETYLFGIDRCATDALSRLQLQPWAHNDEVHGLWKDGGHVYQS